MFLTFSRTRLMYVVQNIFANNRILIKRDFKSTLFLFDMANVERLGGVWVGGGVHVCSIF